MKNLLKYFLAFLFILIAYCSDAQTELERQIKERTQDYSAYQKLKTELDDDSSSLAYKQRINALEELNKLDNEIIDLISEKTPKQNEDSLKVAQLTKENEALNSEMETKSMIQLYLIIAATIFFVLVILFLILYLVALQRRAKLLDDFNIEKQLSQKHASDKEKLTTQLATISLSQSDNTIENYEVLKRDLQQKI